MNQRRINEAIGGDEVIAQDPQHIVKVEPVSRTKATPEFGSARGLIMMTEDFDEPLEDFDEYAG